MPMPMMMMMLMVTVSDARRWILFLVFGDAFLRKTVSLNQVIQSISVETAILLSSPLAQGTT
jgi:hypothetical protein